MALPTIYNQIASNQRRTFLIMFLFTLFLVFVVWVFAQWFAYTGPSALGWVGIALMIAGIMNFFSYFYSDRLVIAVSGARAVQKSDAPELYRTVENLCIADGLPMPKIYVVDDPSPNAFATGRDPKHAAVCATTGIQATLNRQELEGVIAHELSHVKNRDTLVMSVVTVLVGMIALLADWALRMSFWGGMRNDRDREGGYVFAILGLVLAIVAPIIGTLIQLAISRRRESLADASGALLTRNPEELAQALIKISQDPRPVRHATTATAHLYIVNPLKGRLASGIANLFNTHPPIEERVHALRAMELGQPL